MDGNAATNMDGGAGSFWTGRTAATAIFAALAAALGFLLISVPNVELLTFTVFAAGVVLGRLRGAVVGLLGMALYSGANPYGSGLAIPTLFVAQICASALAGFAGGGLAMLWRPPQKRGVRPPLVLVSAAAGFALTVIYQASVVVGVSAMSPEFRTGAMAVLVSNSFFSTLHIVSNTVVFSILGPAVLPRLVRLSLGRLRAGTALENKR